MTESKIVATERLRREGRWEEASRFKDTALREFRAKGMKKAEAADAAWDAMLESYPPLPPVEQPAVSEQVDEPATETGETIGTPAVAAEDIVALLERAGDAEPDLPRDVLWVYENLENRKVKPEQAPSPGAWSLLSWARQYRNRFFEALLPKGLAAREKRAKDAAPEYVEDIGIEEVERLLREVGGIAPADVPEAVRGLLADWSGRFGVRLADDARAALEADVCRLKLG